MGQHEQKKVRISLDLDPEVLKKLDRVCERLKLKRPAVIQMFFSDDPKTIDYITDILKRVDAELFQGCTEKQ